MKGYIRVRWSNRPFAHNLIASGANSPYNAVFLSQYRAFNSLLPHIDSFLIVEINEEFTFTPGGALVTHLTLSYYNLTPFLLPTIHITFPVNEH